MSLSSGSRGSLQRNQSPAKSPTKSYIPEVIKKLKNHPNLPQDISNRASERELKERAEDLTDVRQIMDQYFKTITHDVVQETTREHQEDSDVERELVHSYQRHRQIARSRNRVEKVAKFQVKLLLRYVNREQIPTSFIGKLASVLQMEYGPLHASLLINDRILLEWNSSSLVIPRLVDPQENAVLLAATVQDHVKLERQLSKSYRTYDETELIFEAVSKKLELVLSLAEVIAKYNSKYYYNIIYRNCQNFVLDALQAIGCSDRPVFNDKLKGYFSELKKTGKVPMEFYTHTDLNTFTRENISRLSLENMEYLLGQYFLFHMDSLTRHSGSAQSWRCEHHDCMMDFLEAKVQEKSLLMHHYLHAPRLLNCDSPCQL